MIYTSINGTIVVDLSPGEYCSPEEQIITEHTANTWQPDRELDEIKRDTAQGKCAENVVAAILGEHADNFMYIPYDKIRSEGCRKHAPFDAILTKRNTNQAFLNICVGLIRKDVEESKYGEIRPETRKFCRACRVYLVEIKSSRVSDTWTKHAIAHCSTGDDPDSFRNAMAEEIVAEGSIWKYPCFCRDSAKILSYEQYARYVYDRYPELNGDAGFEHFRDKKLPTLEARDASDIYIRAFVEYSSLKDKKIPVRCYVTGYALSTDIIKNKTIEKFFSNKSKNAIYMTLPLAKRRNLLALLYDDRLWGYH